MAQTSTKTRKKAQLPSMVLLVLLGALLGIFAAWEMAPVAQSGAGFGTYLISLVWLVVSLMLSLYLQVILHEAGHMVFGLLTGYRFVSFRIGSRMIQVENGRLCRRQYSLSGTGGQCLMAPPEMTDGKMPYKLYNMGGVLANLLTGLLAAGLAATNRDVWTLKALFDMLCFVGVGSALLNGIPMQVQGMPNDGANEVEMGRNPAAQRALWVQLSVNARQVQGVPLREMPEEWFALPAEGLDNGMIAPLAVLHANYLMDQQRFAEMAQAIDALEAQDTAILPMHRNMLLCDRLTCALLTGEDAAPWLQRWNEKAMLLFRQQMRGFLSVLRTEYAAALLAERDREKARQIKKQFEWRTGNYPYVSEVTSERALLERIDAQARKGEN